MTTDTIPKILQQFLDNCSAQEIKLIQFKSSATLDKAIAGEEDFDLLVNPRSLEEVSVFARRAGFIKRIAIPIQANPAVADFIGYDAEADVTLHLSIHPFLVFGEKPLKRHVIPFSEWCTWKTVPSSLPGISRFSIQKERQLAEWRFILRWTVSELFYPRITEAIRREIINLDRSLEFNRAGLEESAPASGFLVSPGSFAGRIKASRIWSLRRRLLRELRPWSLYGNAAKYLALILWRLVRQTRKRLVSDSGISIAFVGIDGAGKTTLSRLIQEWLSYKLEARHFYLGEPKRDPFTLLTWALWRTSIRAAAPHAVTSFFFGAFRVLGLHARHRRYRRALNFRNRGGIAIFDRIPLGFFDQTLKMDNPELADSNPFAKKFRKLKSKFDHLPDLIIVLEVNVPLAIERSGDSDEILQAKKQDIPALVKLSTARKVASDSLAIRNVKLLIWELIEGQHLRHD